MSDFNPDTLGIDWLLDCEPRLAQIEALARSYTGFAYRDTRYDYPMQQPLNHAGKPAVGWGHFLEMRVGKTPTLLAEFMLFKRDYGITKMFCLTPNKYKYTWERETVRFGVDVPTHVFESSEREKFTQFMRKTSEGIAFVNYEALIQQDNLKLFEQFIDDRTLMAADESVKIKNRESQFYKNAKELSLPACAVRPMTGKPTPQGVTDLYSQLRFARKIEGVNFYQFRGTYAVMGGFKGKQVKGVKNEKKLHRNAKHDWYFFARRMDWGTKIDSDYEVEQIEMTERQRQAYAEMEKDFVMWLDSGEMVSAAQVITKYLKLQQISSGFIYDEFKECNWLGSDVTKMPKYKALLERLEEMETSKTIIIANFKPTIDALFKVLKKYDPAIICGGDMMKKLGKTADDEKDKFNSSSKCRVMLGQNQAIKYGHTLMGAPDDPCLSMVFFENSYSLDDRSQCEERPQGEGQKDAINILDYYSSPVEKEIIAALQRKEAIAAVIMGYYKNV